MSSCSHCSGDIFGMGAPHGPAGADAVAGVASSAPAAKAAPAERATIFYGGSVLTMDDRNPQAEAVAIAGGKIVAVGTMDDVTARAGSDAQRVEPRRPHADARDRSIRTSTRFPAD